MQTHIDLLLQQENNQFELKGKGIERTKERLSGQDHKTIWLQTCIVLQDKKKDSKSDSVIIRAASLVSKANCLGFTGQMTPAQRLGSRLLHSRAMGCGYFHLDFEGWSHMEPWTCHHQSEGSGKGNAQGNHGARGAPETHDW